MTFLYLNSLFISRFKSDFESPPSDLCINDFYSYCHFSNLKILMTHSQRYREEAACHRMWMYGACSFNSFSSVLWIAGEGAGEHMSVALLSWRSGGWGWINTPSWVRAAGRVERESWGRLYRTGCIQEGHTGIIKPTNPGEGGVWQGKLMTLRTCHGKWPRCHSDKNNTHTEGFAHGLPANPFLVPLALCSHLGRLLLFVHSKFSFPTALIVRYMEDLKGSTVKQLV